MSGSLNRVMLIGNLGKDPELKTFEGGGMLARFPIATSETYMSKKNNEKVTQTEWHTIIVRNRLAEVAERYLKKGDKVLIEGSIRTRSWQDQNGDTKYTTEINTLNMQMLGGNRSQDGQSSQAYSGEQNQNMSASEPNQEQNIDLTSNKDEDDLPF